MANNNMFRLQLPLNRWLAPSYLISIFRCYEAKIEESENQTQDTSGLSRQCSATEPQQPDNHQPSQSSICTAQVVLNASVAHLAATLFSPKFIYFQCEARCLSMQVVLPHQRTPYSFANTNGHKQHSLGSTSWAR